MPALKLALNADFEKKSIKKALFALFQTETTEKLMKLAGRIQLLAVKSHFQLKFCAYSHCLVVVDHCYGWKLKLVNVAVHWRPYSMFQYITREFHALVDCDVHLGFCKVLAH